MKKTEEKRYSISNFDAFIKRKIYSLSHDDAIISQKIRYIEFMLEKEKYNLTGKTFFDITHTVGLDLAVVCKQFFKDIASTKLKSSKTELGKIFGIFLNTTKDLAAATALSESTLSELPHKNADQIYAYEVCALAIAFGLEPHMLFECLYGDKKEKFVLKLEPIDDVIGTNEDEVLILDQEIISYNYATSHPIMTPRLKKQQQITFDYIVNYTDYFLTPRTTPEIVKDFKNIYNLAISPLNIHSFLNKYIGNQLATGKRKELKKDGTVSKKEKLTFTKIVQEHVTLQDIHHDDKPKDKTLIQKLIKKTKNSDKINNALKKKKMELINKLYDVIVANPGKRPSFFLTLFETRAKELEKWLKELKDEGRIEYRGKSSNGGYWAIGSVD